MKGKERKKRKKKERGSPISFTEPLCALAAVTVYTKSLPPLKGYYPYPAKHPFSSYKVEYRHIG
jgi:hypothetical protein